MRRLFPMVLALGLYALMADCEAWAQNPAAGEAIAERHCSRCHAVGLEGESPTPRAPAFRNLVKRYSPAGLEEAVAEGIVAGHPLMPRFVFDPEEIRDLIAYLQTLARSDPQ